MKRAVTTVRADADIDEAIVYYLAEGAGDAALDFVDALESGVTSIRRHPLSGSTRFATELGIPDLRSIALGRFPYVEFYTDDADAIRVHRVLHSSREIPIRFQDD